MEKRIFSTTSTGAIGSPHAKMMNFDPDAKTNSKRIVDLSIKSKMIKLLYENIRENTCELVLGKDFLATTPKAQSLFKK